MEVIEIVLMWNRNGPSKMIFNQIFSSLQGMEATVEVEADSAVADMVTLLINLPCDLYL